ncbi:HAD-IIIC family phosphatase [Sphingomonas parva]|uniref:HAD-IIIC family phosphatase n=1 Tax=Sphingomonas parva TaxID=2555898 RepID=UPI001CDC4856|nr:HAD-IIIC family phosphatase [Sphingomonas parva]
MFEFDKHRPMREASRPRHSYVPAGAPSRRAFLLWGEHCTECAAPDCYASCSLYEARSDGRCRRFEYGVYPNPHFARDGRPAAEVVFRRWGKIEAQANLRLLPSGVVAAAERVAGTLVPWIDRAGTLVARLTGDQRWSWLSYSLLERLNRRLRRARATEPDAFVAEVYNPGEAPVTLLLSMAVDRSGCDPEARPEQLPRPFLRTLTLNPGYNREEVPAGAFGQLISAGLAFSIALTPGAEDGAQLVFLALDLVKQGARSVKRALSPAQPAAKCVIFDLDNTLWDGVLLEGGVRLRNGVGEIFRGLDERGILISVVSKNAPEDALAQLRRLGLEDYLLHPSIGWGPKSDGVRQIAQRLDIGTDSLIFVDDNPFEREEVAGAVPGVEVLPDTALFRLLEHPRLQGAVTEESRRRRLMYREASARSEAAAAYGDDYLDFLRACEIRAEIRPPRPDDRERISELVQRTNQLNFSGRKYRPDEVEALLADPERESYVVRCSDRYGDYGIVGFCLARFEGETLRIDDLMLSCRVQGKFIEEALFAHLAARPGRRVARIAVNYAQTARNGAARAVLDALRFVRSEDGLLYGMVDADGAAGEVVTVEGSWEPALSPIA